MNERRSRLVTALEISFLVLIFSLGFMQPNLNFGGLVVQYTDLIFVVIAGLWLVAIAAGKLDFRFDRFFVLLGMYFVGLLLSAMFSPDPGHSFIKLLGEGYLLLLAVLTANLVRKSYMFKRIIVVWLGASAIGSFIGIITILLFFLGASNLVTEYSLHHYGSLPPGNYPRIQGTFIYPSMLCNYLTLSLLLPFGAYKLAWIKQSIFLILLAAFVVAIAFTITPGIGGVLLGIGFWLWLTLKARKKILLARLSLASGVVGALAFLLVSAFSLRPIETSPFFFTFLGQRIDPTQRFLTWEASLRTFIENPVFGKGLGLYVAQVVFRAPSGELQLLTDAHNTWLNVAGQAGLFALIPLILICVALVGRTLPFRLDGEKETTLRVCLGIAFVAAFLYQGLIGSFENARHLWVLAGMIVGLTANDESSSRTMIIS